MGARAAAVLSTLGLAAAAWSGCTFGGLANYSIEQCDPQKKTQTEDVCDRLNRGDPMTCTPYQCDAASRHCVQRTRDDDRDGDPPPACGGSDCDDADPIRSGKASEVCDEKDNNCNGLIDEDVVKPGGERVAETVGALGAESNPMLAPVDATRVVASYVQTTCIPIAVLEPGTQQVFANGDCYLLKDTSFVARQPFARLVDQGVGAAFVRKDGCPTGQLGYAFRGSTSAAALLGTACDAQHPASLPAISAMPGNAKSGVIAWFQAPLSNRADAINGCSSAAPAPLELLFLDGQKFTDVPASLDPAAVLATPELSTSTRPPALLSLNEAGGIVMAAPMGSDAAVWLLLPTSLGALPAPTHIPALGGAHEIAMAARVDGGTITLGLVATVGCSPQTSVVAVIGTLDPAKGTFTFGDAITVAPAGKVATMPSAAWAAKRGGELWAGWIDSDAHLLARRIGADKKPIGGPLDTGHTLLVAALSGTSDGATTAFGYDPNQGTGAFVEIPLGCGN